MRFGILLLAAGLLVACGEQGLVQDRDIADTRNSSIKIVSGETKNDKEARFEIDMCAFQITMVDNAIYLRNAGNTEYANSNKIDEAIKLAEEECAFLQTNDDAFQELAIKHLKQSSKKSSNIKFEYIDVVSNHPSTPKRRVIAEVSSDSSRATDFPVIKFHIFIDPETYQWVVE